MSENTTFVAVDLGAESGRVMLGTLHGGRLDLNQVHRFANLPILLPDGVHWNVPQLYREVLVGLRAAARAHPGRIVGVGVDSWALDYALIDRGGRLLGMPYHYRDARTHGISEQVAQVIPPSEQYRRTGIAQLPFNTLYQLVAQRRAGDRALDLAQSLLLIPDLLHFWLTGLRAAEYTNASTTGILSIDGNWASDLLMHLDLPTNICLPPSPSGMVLGPVRPAVREETGLGSARVVLPATHDTACAVVAVPTDCKSGSSAHAYISSGTWSLLGVELDRPILSEGARLAGFTNERGVAGTYRFLTNITGLWLLQECRRAWIRQGHEWNYQDLNALAAAEPSPGVVIDVADSEFLHPDHMPEAIGRHLRRTGQRPVEGVAALARAILEGLALAYRMAIEQSEHLAETRVDTIHVVGGGALSSCLCQLTADACQRHVTAGPVEATAMGNILVQALGLGHVQSLTEARAIVTRSVDLVMYEPRSVGDWDDRAGRLRAMRLAAPTSPDVSVGAASRVL